MSCFALPFKSYSFGLVDSSSLGKKKVLCSLFCTNKCYYLCLTSYFFLPSAGLDIGPISDDPSSLPQPNVNQSSRPLSEEQLDGILSPELDKMVTDGNFFLSLILVFWKT